MPLTPADIHHIEFAKAPRGRRGYDVEQVDALLDEVSEEMAGLLEEKNTLRQRAGAPAGLAAAGHALRAELDQARRECEAAEERATALRHRLDEVRQAPGPATAPGGDTPGRDTPGRDTSGGDIGKVMAMARRTADDHLAEARQRSQALAAEAREQSDRVIHDAARTVREIEEQAGRRQQEATAEQRAGHAALRQEIDELTRLAAGYRAALERHVHDQSRLLGGTALTP